MFCWNWYAANVAGGLTVKLGLLPTLLIGLRMRGITRELFVKKIGLIVEMFEHMSQEKD
jgi:hypothetical protein